MGLGQIVAQSQGHFNPPGVAPAREYSLSKHFVHPFRKVQPKPIPVDDTMSPTTRAVIEADHPPVLTLDTINRHVRDAQYAVRGELAIRAEKYRERLAAGEKLPFDEITLCNIGNPQQLGQKPITFFRQVSALVDCPSLLAVADSQGPDGEALRLLFPADVIARAQKLAKAVGSTGSYSHSQGVPCVRQNVARFISERDGGVPANPDDIFLTSGASDGVRMLLNCIISGPEVGVLIPIPQYPLYSAALTLMHGRPVPYGLNETAGWSMSVADLTASVRAARENGTDVRALVVINPGNPTGQCLSEENIREIIEFARNERLIIMADEVYQTNVYYPEDRPFHSFKKVLRSMGPSFDNVELVSFHSTSKGVLGECGRRGGYFELCGFSPAVRDQLYKLASISLCPSVHGQIMVDLMVNPPKEGDTSFPLYQEETSAIFNSLKQRAEQLTSVFVELEGVTCERADGAMYTFPRIRLPAKAIAAAEEAGQAPDLFYCLALLDSTGIERFARFTGLLRDFHQKFMEQYRDE
ncbi:alanine transaminase [Fonticula alba]|uniref:Alanine transaminase n=1 Tax=Fonticula alba TaxID=691883 RepID=A0A058Z4Z0_FONAL|nr:alanine transaminase [Fonticula alba]KCV69340.1 alanine transaminase [Fonticula alba]|eukprot:XP_009495905.1 alanine transaminase [Fonticula alba]